MEHAAQTLGYSVILVESQEDKKIEKESSLKLIQHGVDGAIWCPTSEQNPFAKQTLPIVVIDKITPHSRRDQLSANYSLGGQLIAEHILELNHKKIGIISRPSRTHGSDEKVSALKTKLGNEARVAWEHENSLIPAINDRATFALCGFGNFGSLAIMIGGVGSMVPDRRDEIIRLGFWALLVSVMTNCLTASIAGMLFE